MEAARISVIIPVYKVEKYLDKCVRSVMCQTYKDLQIILVDDGSPDRSGEMADELAKEDARITVVHRPNGGLSAARNSGLEIADGAYICFLDSDDWIDADMLEKMQAAMEKEAADLAICGLTYEYEGECEHLEDPVMAAEVLGGEELMARLCAPRAANYVIACSRLCRAELFKTLRFPEGKLHEDEFTAHHLFDRVKRAVTLPDKFYHYLRRGGSITGAPVSVRHLDGAEAFYERFGFLKKTGRTALLADTACGFVGAYITVLKDLDPKTAEDKTRLKAICAMGGELLREYPEAAGRKETLAVEHPMLWKALFRLKGMIRRRSA